MLESAPRAGKATPVANNLGDLAGAGQWLQGWENNTITDPRTKGAEQASGLEVRLDQVLTEQLHLELNMTNSLFSYTKHWQ